MKETIETIIDDNRCPTCGRINDRVTCVSDPMAKPRPGDFCVCIACASPMRFGDDLRARACTQRDIDEMDPESAYLMGMTAGAILRARK